MDNTTLLITVSLSICIAMFGILAIIGSLYGILVCYPRYPQKKVDALKATGRQGEATIILLPDHELGTYPGRRAVFTRVQIGLEIRVPGIDAYEVDKIFTIPSHVLDRLVKGKFVEVWADPKAPRNLDKIVIDIK
jgi:hypothetical protein